jgi:hypothetical protein
MDLGGSTIYLSGELSFRSCRYNTKHTLRENEKEFHQFPKKNGSLTELILDIKYNFFKKICGTFDLFNY